jgi:hypothetical protein
MARAAPTPQTPLAAYLAAHPGLTHVELGRRLEPILGAAPSSSSMTQWVAGQSAPRPEVQLAIEEATGGAVTCRAWAEWRRACIAQRARRRGPRRSTG